MAGDAVGEGARYWAFISYSHKDAAVGRRLHQRLERYRLPRKLVGRSAARGIVPRRLSPIFRDLDELPAATDLSAEVREALQASASLIVVCSPAAAASPWVSREVELFRRLHPERPILAAIIDGEPADCFPGALVATATDGTRLEPLAADFREHHDGERLALLKLVSGILGLGLDELVQRDAQRRLRSVMAVTAAALAAMVVMGALTAFALSNQWEAEHQRGRSEGLVAFMSTDLREKLRGVGRLDVMGAVNQRALAYYDQDSEKLSSDARANLGLLLLGLGEDAEARGDHKAAVADFRKASSITSVLMEADPDNPERVFDQAQSVYWNGYASYTESRFKDTEASFEKYRELAERMIALAPHEPRYIRELAFAEGNLCTLALTPPKRPKAAVTLCESALRHMQSAAAKLRPSIWVDADLANRHAWLGDSYRAAGDDGKASEQRLITERMLEELMKSDPMNAEFKTEWLSQQRALARIAVRVGRLDEARSRLGRASALSNELVVFDPNNAAWRAQKSGIDKDLAKLNQTSSKGEKQ